MFYGFPSVEMVANGRTASAGITWDIMPHIDKIRYFTIISDRQISIDQINFDIEQN